MEAILPQSVLTAALKTWKQLKVKSNQKQDCEHAELQILHIVVFFF